MTLLFPKNILLFDYKKLASFIPLPIVKVKRKERSGSIFFPGVRAISF